MDKDLNGDFVEQERLHIINIKGGEEGKTFIIPNIKSYEDDKEFLTLLYKQARQNFEYRVKMYDGVLAAIGSESEEKNETKKFCRALNKGKKSPEEQLKAATNDIGKWIGDYLMYVGYNPHVFFLSSFLLLVRSPRSQSLLIMVWCSSKTEHRLRLPLDSGPI